MRSNANEQQPARAHAAKWDPGQGSEGQGTGAGEDEVAHAGQAAHGQRVGAQRDGQPRHLAEAARDQRRAAVAAKAEPVADAARQRQHILQRTAKLHPCSINHTDILASARREIRR